MLVEALVEADLRQQKPLVVGALQHRVWLLWAATDLGKAGAEKNKKFKLNILGA